MKKIIGVKSVDFKIIASGNGVVNNNGSIKILKDGSIRENHTIPKLRGFSSYIINDDNIKKSIDIEKEFDPKKHILYVSSNTIRNALFYDEGVNFTNKLLSELVKTGNIFKSQTGLIRGYLDAKTQLSKKSPLLLEDFVDTLGNATAFEQFSNSKSGSDSNSIFSKTTFGETKYISYGSISLEDLQFICLDGIYGRAQAFEIVTENQEKELINLGSEVAEYIKSLDFDDLKNRNPKVIYGRNYLRTGSKNPIGEFGLLLNDDALDILVDFILYKIENLFINQAKGHLEVIEVLVDYNDGKPMRIKHDESSINSIKGNNKYSIYYEDTNEKFYEDKKQIILEKRQKRIDKKTETAEAIEISKNRKKQKEELKKTGV